MWNRVVVVVAPIVQTYLESATPCDGTRMQQEDYIKSGTGWGLAGVSRGSGWGGLARQEIENLAFAFATYVGEGGRWAATEMIIIDNDKR